MYKRLLSVLLLTVILFSFSSCSPALPSRGTTPTSSAADVSPAPTAAPTDPPAAPPTEAPTEPPTEEPIQTTSEDDYSEYYIFPNSGDDYLTEELVYALDPDLLELARMEVFARRGRRFYEEETQAYFDAQPWYNGVIEVADFDDGILNDFENYNIRLLHKRSLEIREEEDPEFAEKLEKLRQLLKDDKDDQNGGSSNSGGSALPDGLCRVCGGLGSCIRCGGTGNCQTCFGRRTIPCTNCTAGKCYSCSGSGTVYKYVGLLHGKYTCDVCHGSGNCNVCRGRGERDCIICGGGGGCNTCSGSGDCGYCHGTGHAY